MRIVQLLPEMNEGGVERGVLDLNRELVKHNIKSIVISSGGKLVHQILTDGGEHHKINVSSKNPFSFLFRVLILHRKLKTIQPDVIHVRSRLPAWLLYFANKSLKIPIVSTVHGFNSVSRYSKIMTMSNHVICVSNAIKSYIQKHYNTDEKNITVIPRGIDLEKFNPDNLDNNFINEFNEKYCLENNFIVTMVGRITQLKDIETFINAIAISKKHIPNIKALIVGGVRNDKEDYFKSLKLLVKNLNISDNIIFTGSQSKVAEIYHISNIVISSSKKPESFGRSAAEALAMNTPVIATGHGGILDIVKSNKTGLIFEIGNSEQLSQNIIKLDTIRLENLREFVKKNFTLESMVNKTIYVYKKVGEK